MIKTNLASLSIFLLTLVVFTAQAQTVEIRKLSPFSKINTGGSWDVILQKGDYEEIRLETKGFDLSKVRTEVNNNSLDISLVPGNHRNVNLTVYVTYKELESIVSSGSGNLRSSEDLEAEDLEIVMSGSGNTTLNQIFANSLSIKMTGSGNMQIDGGAVDNLTLRQTGSGNFQAIDLEAGNSDISKSGSGNTHFTANESISIRSSGSGDIQYKGNPKSSDVRITGSGRLIKK